MRSTLDDSLTGLVAVSQRLTDLPVKVETQQEFKDGLRAMLLATAEREGIGITAKDPEPEVSRRGLRSLRRPAGSRPAVSRRTRTRGAIVVGLAAGTLALSGMSAASGDAIPGDALYSVKRSTEKAQLALAGSDISRGQLYLEFARTRLDEAQAVKDPAGLTAVLDDMDSETLEGVRLLTATAVGRKDSAALDAIDAFTSTQRAGAEKLRNGVNGDARARAAKSADPAGRDRPPLQGDPPADQVRLRRGLRRRPARTGAQQHRVQAGRSEDLRLQHPAAGQHPAAEQPGPDRCPHRPAPRPERLGRHQHRIGDRVRPGGAQ